MKEEKKISIAIPVYNTEKYLERCIYSILNQTYKNLEVICVDDGSTDLSGKILDRLSQEDSRLKILHKKNEGVSIARNLALLEAKGEYIGFIDSDDYVAPDYYEKLIDVLDNTTVDIVTCSYFFDYSGSIVRAENKNYVPQNPLNTQEFLPYIYERDLYKGVASYLWTKLIRRELIKQKCDKLDIYFRKEYEGADDVVFLAELYMKSTSIQYLDIPLYYYFQREGSIVHIDSADMEWNWNTMKWVESYEWILSKYQYQGINEHTLDIIKRMYVYRCGKLLELAKKNHDNEKMCILQKKIRNELLTYIKMNMEHLDRVQWIIGLLI